MKKLFFVLAFLIPLIIHAQTIKTDVLVIGKSDAAFAAGLQAGKSGVKTTVLTQGDGFDLINFENNRTYIENIFFVKMRKVMRVPNNQKLAEPTKQTLNVVIKAIEDSLKTFTILNELSAMQIEKSGNGWEVKLNDGKIIKSKTLIITEFLENIFKKSKIAPPMAAQSNLLTYDDNKYRTTIGALNPQAPLQYISLYNLITPNIDNLIYTTNNSLKIGQIAGATAAYATFFKKNTSESNLKQIQSRLLNNKLSLLPLDDLREDDPNWLDIQKVGITGILKADIKNGKAFFSPEKEVTYDEIKQPLKDYYYKAQIWFDDHQSSPINLESTISMVCYVGNKAIDATKTEIEKKWKKNYRFSSKYDLKKVLTRREFSVIINEYLRPFDDVNVDRTGQVIR